MKMSDFIQTWQGTRVENKVSRLIIASLIFIITVLSFFVLNKEQLVVIQPATLSKDAWITQDNASQSYKEAWGLFLAQLTGNITPANLTFVRERLGPLLSPSIYNEVMDSMISQADAITKDRISYRFEPAVVSYEESTGKVFVTGTSVVKSSVGQERNEQRTYEYQIAIRNYLPMVNSIKTYAGEAQSQEVLRRIMGVPDA